MRTDNTKKIVDDLILKEFHSYLYYASGEISYKNEINIAIQDLEIKPAP